MTRPRLADDELAELRDLIRGADRVELKLSGEQQTKTRRALEFFSARLER